MNDSVETTPCKKVTITITRKQMWNNFVDSWKDCVWDTPTDNFSLNEVNRVLLTNSTNYNVMSVRRLFRMGLTMMLMGNAMDHIDSGESNLIEIIVVDGDNKIIVRHEDISY